MTAKPVTPAAARTTSHGRSFMVSSHEAVSVKCLNLTPPRWLLVELVQVIARGAR